MIDKAKKAVKLLYGHLVTNPLEFAYIKKDGVESLTKKSITIKRVNGTIGLFHKGKPVPLTFDFEKILNDGFDKCLKSQKENEIKECELILSDLMRLIDL